MVDLVNELAGKVAIVTGSARNIGRATALELAHAGAAVVINARVSGDLCEQVAHEITAAGGRALPFVADITDADAVARMVDAARAEFGGIDILVNNAASRSRVPFVDLDDETWDFTLGVTFQCQNGDHSWLEGRAGVADMNERKPEARDDDRQPAFHAGPPKAQEDETLEDDNLGYAADGRDQTADDRELRELEHPCRFLEPAAGDENDFDRGHGQGDLPAGRRSLFFKARYRRFDLLLSECV